MKSKICQLHLLAVLIAALLIVPANPQAQTTEKVRIVYASNSLAFLVPFVAKDRGLYAKAWQSTPNSFKSQPGVAMAALLSGDVDYVELIGSVIRSAAEAYRYAPSPPASRRPSLAFSPEPIQEHQRPQGSHHRRDGHRRHQLH